MIDSALVGFWGNASGTIRFSADGWLSAVGDSQASISTDGMVLTDSGTAFDRVLGSGQEIFGLWRRSETDSGVLWTEDRLYRDDGTYTIQWLADGSFDSILFGDYSFRGGVLATQERRAQVETNPPNVLSLDVLFGIDAAGTYALLPSGQLQLTLGGVTTVYDPV